MTKKTKSLEQQEKEMTAPINDTFEGLKLTQKQQRFVMAYCRPDMYFNATRAYAEAYDINLETDYPVANASAARLLANVSVMEAIDRERKKFAENHEALSNFVMQEWTKMAQADITEMLNITGPIVMVKDINEIPPHLRNLIESIKTTSTGVEVKLRDRDKALDNIAKALGMTPDTIKNVNEDYESLVQKIDRKRREGKLEDDTNIPD